MEQNWREQTEGQSEVIYVTGHRHPDTDSVASAIAYAFFKRARGYRAVPCRLGPLNAESKYLLERFHFKEPELLEDARVRLSEIRLDPVTYITPETTIYDCMQKMQDEGRTYCGVVDADKKLVGFVTKSDIAVIGLGDTATSVGIMARTPVENYRKTIGGTTVYDDPKVHLNGKVSIVAMTDEENLKKYSIRDRIVIIGDDPEAQKEVLRAGAGLLICVWTQSIREDVLEEARAAHCPIILSGHGSMNTSRYLYFAPPVSTIMQTKLVLFKSNELAEDVGTKMLRTRYHVYPVVDTENHLVGYVSRYHIMNCRNKQIIMVDHNEFSQSVRAIEKARVLEVIDHHRISDFASSSPVAFRNEIVGSTATIVATIFRENQIPIPENLAGLLLGAVLSDTMNFHSPTTTQRDIETANLLAAVADLDRQTFASEMFAVTSSTEGKTVREMIEQDMKIYDIRGCKLSISQAVVPSAKTFLSDGAGSIQAALERFAAKKQLDLSVMVFSSIMENGSVLYTAGARAPWAGEAFPQKEDEHRFFEGLLSRKQQVLPKLTEVIERYM